MNSLEMVDGVDPVDVFLALTIVLTGCTMAIEPTPNEAGWESAQALEAESDVVYYDPAPLAGPRDAAMPEMDEGMGTAGMAQQPTDMGDGDGDGDREPESGDGDGMPPLQCPEPYTCDEAGGWKPMGSDVPFCGYPGVGGNNPPECMIDADCVAGVCVEFNVSLGRQLGCFLECTP